MKLSTTNAPTYRHCPGCRRIRPTRSLGRIVIRNEHLDVVECQEPPCGLRWCLSAQPLIGVAA
jgi:hypothetical protein